MVNCVLELDRLYTGRTSVDSRWHRCQGDQHQSLKQKKAKYIPQPCLLTSDVLRGNMLWTEKEKFRRDRRSLVPFQRVEAPSVARFSCCRWIVRGSKSPSLPFWKCKTSGKLGNQPGFASSTSGAEVGYPAQMCRPSVIKLSRSPPRTRSRTAYKSGTHIVDATCSLTTPLPLCTPAMFSLPKPPMASAFPPSLQAENCRLEEARELSGAEATPTLMLPSMSDPEVSIQRFFSASPRLPILSHVPTSPVSPVQAAHAVAEVAEKTLFAEAVSNSTPYWPRTREGVSNPFWPRERGDNGRFVPGRKASKSTSKRCGWCLTQETSQWRIGAVCCTVESGMRVLCNACGINFRRATAKRAVEEGPIDLDALAREMGPARPTIQKALKRATRSRLDRAKQGMRENATSMYRDPRSVIGLTNVSSLSGRVVKRRTVGPCSQVVKESAPALPSIQTLLKSIGARPISGPSFSVGESRNSFPYC